MNTPAHLLIGAAAFGRGDERRLILAAMAGGLLPDLSLYVMAGVSLMILQIPPQVVFNELYYSDLWQAIFAVDNSFLVWGALLGLAVWRRSAWGVALTSAALLHIALDFPLHHDDGRPHFWPISDWVFESPISYWDRAHHAMWVGPIETTLSALCAALIWLRRPGWVISVLVGLLLIAQFRTTVVWMFVFQNS